MACGDTNRKISPIASDNDLQLLLPTISRNNQLIVNNASATSLQIGINHHQVLILAIAQAATVILPDATNGAYSLINSSTSVINLTPSNGYTILGKTQYSISPYSTVELNPLSMNKCWVFL
ncbi:MAG: hypothetical protein KBD37_01710 [Burkholderiales bacterium]|nr:hypothetical protein [Burkholderiales bacterium]